METKVMLSNRHVHLTKEDAAILLGEDGGSFDRYLTGDSGPFSLKETVTLAGPKGEIGRVKILGPFRAYTQAEILRSDSFKLGIAPPVRATGHLDGAAALKIIGPCGEVTRNCAIIAHRHIHMKKDIAEELGYENGQAVKVRAPGVRGLVFENVLISLGGRGLPFILIACMVTGSAIGGVSTVGVAQNAFRYGLSAGFYNVAWAIGALLAGLFLVQKIRATALFIGIALIGGMWGAAVTNLVNVIVIYIGIAICVIVLYTSNGGISGINAALPQEGYNWWSPVKGAGAVVIVGFFLLPPKLSRKSTCWWAWGMGSAAYLACTFINTAWKLCGQAIYTTLLFTLLGYAISLLVDKRPAKAIQYAENA